MNNEEKHNSNEDKRKTPRIEEKSKVTVTVLLSPEAPEIEGKSFYCWTRDLSEGGLKFAVHSHVPIGALLKLEIEFLDGPKVEFQHNGNVMWEQEFNEDGIISNWLGVKFTETLDGEERLSDWNRVIREKLERKTEG